MLISFGLCILNAISLQSLYTPEKVATAERQHELASAQE